MFGVVTLTQRFANKEVFEKAVADFRLALSYNPNHSNAKNYLVETLLTMGKLCEDDRRLEDACDLYTQVLEVDEGSEEAKEMLMACQKLLMIQAESGSDGGRSKGKKESRQRRRESSSDVLNESTQKLLEVMKMEKKKMASGKKSKKGKESKSGRSAYERSGKKKRKRRHSSGSSSSSSGDRRRSKQSKRRRREFSTSSSSSSIDLKELISSPKEKLKDTRSTPPPSTSSIIKMEDPVFLGAKSSPFDFFNRSTFIPGLGGSPPPSLVLEEDKNRKTDLPSQMIGEQNSERSGRSKEIDLQSESCRRSKEIDLQSESCRRSKETDLQSSRRSGGKSVSPTVQEIISKLKENAGPGFRVERDRIEVEEKRKSVERGYDQRKHSGMRSRSSSVSSYSSSHSRSYSLEREKLGKRTGRERYSRSRSRSFSRSRSRSYERNRRRESQSHSFSKSKTPPNRGPTKPLVKTIPKLTGVAELDMYLGGRQLLQTRYKSKDSPPRFDPVNRPPLSREEIKSSTRYQKDSGSRTGWSESPENDRSKSRRLRSRSHSRSSRRSRSRGRRSRSRSSRSHSRSSRRSHSRGRRSHSRSSRRSRSRSKRSRSRNRRRPSSEWRSDRDKGVRDEDFQVKKMSEVVSVDANKRNEDKDIGERRWDSKVLIKDKVRGDVKVEDGRRERESSAGVGGSIRRLADLKDIIITKKVRVSPTSPPQSKEMDNKPMDLYGDTEISGKDVTTLKGQRRLLEQSLKKAGILASDNFNSLSAPDKSNLSCSSAVTSRILMQPKMDDPRLNRKTISSKEFDLMEKERKQQEEKRKSEEMASRSAAKIRAEPRTDSGSYYDKFIKRNKDRGYYEDRERGRNIEDMEEKEVKKKDEKEVSGDMKSKLMNMDDIEKEIERRVQERLKVEEAKLLKKDEGGGGGEGKNKKKKGDKKKANDRRKEDTYYDEEVRSGQRSMQKNQTRLFKEIASGWSLDIYGNKYYAQYGVVQSEGYTKDKYGNKYYAGNDISKASSTMILYTLRQPSSGKKKFMYKRSRSKSIEKNDTSRHKSQAQERKQSSSPPDQSAHQEKKPSSYDKSSSRGDGGKLFDQKAKSSSIESKEKVNDNSCDGKERRLDCGGNELRGTENELLNQDEKKQVVTNSKSRWEDDDHWPSLSKTDAAKINTDDTKNKAKSAKSEGFEGLVADYKGEDDNNDEEGDGEDNEESLTELEKFLKNLKQKKKNQWIAEGKIKEK